MSEIVQVGGASIPRREAIDFARRYLTSTTETWAYPAYDGYPGSPGPAVGEADLLAVSLLNAGQNPLSTYYGFSSILDVLNGRLGDPKLTGSFGEADGGTLDAIADLYGVLDAHPLPQVGLTKLSKVLHRKRPDLLPLYDANIRRCYFSGAESPVLPVKGRSWTKMVRAWLPAVHQDLVTQMSVWEEIAVMAPGPRIFPLRALDIIGWHLGERRTR